MGHTLVEASVTRDILVVGKESVGKSALVGALTGSRPASSNFRGTTVRVERYTSDAGTFVDTPGLFHRSDSASVAETLAQLAVEEAVILVVQATHIDDDLAEMLPLVAGKRGVVVVTYWDMIGAEPSHEHTLDTFGLETGVPFIPIDARKPSPGKLAEIRRALEDPGVFADAPITARAGWKVEPPPGWFEKPWVGPILAILCLLAPALLAVWGANTFAGWVDPLIARLLAGPVEFARSWPEPLAAVFAGDYGLLTMGPLLFVWAVPTVVVYAVLLGIYKASGLVERISVSMEPLVRPFGLSGRDVVRVVMGFGCNVPAVISTRSCSACSRGQTIRAIAFGAACSYQFPATLAVFAAVGWPWLVLPYVAYLLLTTLVYLRLTAPRASRSRLNLIVVEGRTFLQWPRAAGVWREASGVVTFFFGRALPIFFAITVVASLLAWGGVLTATSNVVGPVMALFRLPPEAALPVILASIRKDGILLFAADRTGATLLLGPVQVLTGVYLAGVLLPCLVTALTIARELSTRFALGLVGTQTCFAVGFAALLGWGGCLIASL